MSQSIIEGLRDYFAECPLLSGCGSVDWVSDTVGSYGIIPESDSEIKKFISGGGKREFSFSLQIRLETENKKSIENPELMEEIERWCAVRNAEKNFPHMGSGCIPTKISAEKGVLHERDKAGRTGLYKIRFKLNYIKK